MPDNDTLGTAAPEVSTGTPVQSAEVGTGQQQQTTESAPQTQGPQTYADGGNVQGTPLPQPVRVAGREFRTLEELQQWGDNAAKLIGRKTVPADAVQSLFGGAQQTNNTQGQQAQQVSPQQAAQVQAEAQQAYQQAGGGQAGQRAYEQVFAQYGFTPQQIPVLQFVAKQMAQQVVQEQLQALNPTVASLIEHARVSTAKEALMAAADELDAMGLQVEAKDLANRIGERVKADPYLQQLMQYDPAGTIRSLSLLVAGDIKAQATKAAKAAGAASEQARQQAAAAASVEQPGSRGQMAGTDPGAQLVQDIIRSLPGGRDRF